jgi:hypothetical protein
MHAIELGAIFEPNIPRYLAPDPAPDMYVIRICENLCACTVLLHELKVFRSRFRENLDDYV